MHVRRRGSKTECSERKSLLTGLPEMGVKWKGNQNKKQEKSPEGGGSVRQERETQRRNSMGGVGAEMGTQRKGGEAGFGINPP